ncbi:DUF22 domain-containing protein [Geoglobus acetivorans]|uniref:DUF22 domain-containing protein n=1 Tax=Geoglobus acetivorans TaxID=565033 RepID=A0A0A7GCE8_GEOAI|nr:hypothetical protein GACE_0637 [Geoglobus acetivorans]
MRAAVATLKNPESREIGRKEISFKNAIFKSAGHAYWKTIIADESKIVRKDRLEVIRIREIELPQKSTIAPLSIFRHAYGTTIDVLTDEIRKIEEVRKIRYAYFYGIDYGEIEPGDIIGVIKVYPINVGSMEKIEYLKPPETRPKLEKIQGSVVYKEGDLVYRKRIIIEEPWYSRWHIGEWRMLVADEDVSLEPGNGRMIKIRPVEIPRNTIPVPLYGHRHPLGTIIDVYSPGRPRRIEERKLITGVYFLPAEGGEIRKGDVIGVLNLYTVSIGEMFDKIVPFLNEKVRGNVVVRENNGLKRIEFEHTPFLFRRSSIGYLKPIISAETKTIRANRPERILLEKIDIPAGSVIQPMGGRGHAYGITIDVELEAQRFVEEDRVVDSAIIISPFDGEILRGDMIGVLMQYQITPLTSPELFVRKYG